MNDDRPRRLAGSASPYLALYVDDPVSWWPWGQAAFAEARRRDLPLLVSVGFYACHWCHVLHKESLRNTDIAALINRSFVPVKVDREIHGALDAALQDFALRHAGRRGWPIQVLVTPEGHPVDAGLYAPPQAFRDQLAIWAQRWRTDPQAVRSAARTLAPRAATPPARGAGDAAHARSLRLRWRTEALRRADMLQGGFGAVARFPSAPQLLALLALRQRDGDGDGQLDEFLQLTLAQIASQGLRDHVGGGFFRYTVDPAWREPHFEKMAADNALLSLVFLRAALVLQQPAWREVALHTLDFMRRDLLDLRAGGFASSLSAQDAQGRDGAQYLWRTDQLAGALPAEELAAVTRVWGLRGAPVYPLGHLPVQAQVPTDHERVLLARAHQRLRALRSRARHPRDGKLLAGVNGLALAALAEAAVHEPSARDAADRLLRFIDTQLWDGRRLLRLAGSSAEAELDDHAFVSWGLARYAAVTGSVRARSIGTAVARAGWSLFYREGWQRELQPLLAGLGPEAVLVDTDMPSSSATLILASLELGDAALAQQARQALRLGAWPPAGAAWGWATQAVALDAAQRAAPAQR